MRTSTGDDATCYVVGRPPPHGQTSPKSTRATVAR